MAAAQSTDANPERTQVLYGVENIINFTLQRFSLIKERSDTCIDSAGPSVLITTEPIREAIMDFRQRGIRHRVITEINKENISYCKELMEFVDELRHIDGIKGNFSVSERDYQATAIIQQALPLTESMHTTVRSFVEQQQYVFETLWNKAIPAKQRFREIEEGTKREFIETIQDPAKTGALLSKLIKSSTEEILTNNILFSK